MLTRLSEKINLSKYDLDLDLFNKFDLKVNDVYPVRSVFLISTDSGHKILKKVNYTKQELNYIVSLVRYIKEKFPRVIDFKQSIDETPYTMWNNEMYCIMDLIDGRECDFNNPIDLTIAAKGLADLHKASAGFKCELYYKNINGKLIDNLCKKKEEMEFFKNIVENHELKNEFDKIFMDNIDFYLNQMKHSIEVLKNSSYYKICSEEDKVVVCHHDLAYHNIMIQNEDAYFIDFDYSVIDLRVHDLCNFINKVVKNFAFDLEKAKLILDEYNKNSSLDKRELEILYGMLLFPEPFYSISKDYYRRRKDWDEETFINRLAKKVEFKEDREQFLDKFKGLLH